MRFWIGFCVGLFIGASMGAFAYWPREVRTCIDGQQFVCKQETISGIPKTCSNW